jgi:hypothetical protein
MQLGGNFHLTRKFTPELSPYSVSLFHLMRLQSSLVIERYCGELSPYAQTHINCGLTHNVKVQPHIVKVETS